MTTSPTASPTTGPLLLTPYQHQRLLEPIPNERVSVANKQSHLEQWDVRRTLTRFFGIGGWRIETKRLWCIGQIEVPPGAVFQTKWIDGKKHENVPNDRSLWTVIYGAEVRLTVHGLNGSSAYWEDGATGDSQNQPTLGDAHDMALKTALSQAMKRAAVNLGDQFGLSLYNKGNRGQVVHGTLAPYLLVTPTDPEAAPTGAALPERDEQVETSHDPTVDAPAGFEVDDDDGQTYATAPSGGLADDMRDADVHPLPPERPRRLDVSSTPADHVRRAREDLDRLTGQNHAPQQAALDALARGGASNVTPILGGRAHVPDDGDTVEDAGRRGIERARAARQLTAAEEQATTPPPVAVDAAQRTATLAAAWLAEVYTAHTDDELRDTWPHAEALYRTNLRPHISAPIAAILGLPAGGNVFPSLVLTAAKKHLEVEGGASVHDHLALDLAPVGADGLPVVAQPEGARP